jgi:hypothetical protein
VTGACIVPISFEINSSRDGMVAKAFTPSWLKTLLGNAPPLRTSLSLVLAKPASTFAAETGSVLIA